MKTLRFVLEAYRKNVRWTLVGVVSSLLGTACQVVIPVFFKLVIDELSPEAEVHRGIAAWGEGVVRALVGEQADVAVYIQASLGVAVAFAAALAVATFYKRYYLIRLSRKVEYELKKEMYEHLQNLPGRYYDAKRSGGLMSLMTSDVEAVRMMIGPAIMYLSSTLLLTPAALAIMLTLNATLTGFALLPLVGLALATLYFSALRANDRVAVKPHASPVLHAIEYLCGRQSLEQLERFRSLGGAQSYPSRTKDKIAVDFSTGSVGLGVAVTAFASLTQDYLNAHGLLDPQREGRFIALLGDAELDEGNIYEALIEAYKHDIRNTWWIVDYNRQSLDATT
ncbi:hypothetical protein EDM80_15970, partial [bacterium]